MSQNDHRREPPGPLTYAEIYRQVVVTLRKSGSFVSRREQLYQALEEDHVQYEPLQQFENELEHLWMVAILLAETEDVAQVIEDLRSRQDLVEDAEQNRPLRSNAINDPFFWDQWALHKIAAEAAWAKMINPQPVVVAIIDTGISPTHPDLTLHLWDDGFGNHGHNVLTNTSNVADADGHGTLLAGTIGAVSNNALGIAAAEWPIQLMAIKFHDVRTPPTALYAIVGIVWAVLRGAKVINASWDVGLPIGFLRIAIQFAGLAGAVVVAAAGNDGLDNDKLKTYPASFNLDNLVSVMATDEDDDKPGFSNYGLTTVHLAAPGVRILSTHSYFVAPPSYLAPPHPRFPMPPQWRYYSGTSAACAHVASAAALLMALPNLPPALIPLTPKKIRDRLMATVDKRPWLRCIARGRLNLEKVIPPP